MYIFLLWPCALYVCISKGDTYRVVWIGHRVEGSHSQRVFIKHIEVGIILRRKESRCKQSIVVFKETFWIQQISVDEPRQRSLPFFLYNLTKRLRNQLLEMNLSVMVVGCNRVLHYNYIFLHTGYTLWWCFGHRLCQHCSVVFVVQWFGLGCRD